MSELVSEAGVVDAGRNRRWIALALLAVTQFMVLLDQTVVTIATPTIGAELSISQANLSWITNAYVLAFGGFLLLGGRACDLLGTRRMFIGGVLLFTAASLLSGFSPNEATLIVGRVGQGLGAAVLSPAALASVAGIFPEGAERNRAMGIWAAAAGSGASIGVLLGGLLTSGPGWQWIFWINVPIGLLGAALSRSILPENRVVSERRRLDVGGAVTVTGGVALFIYGITQSEQSGWGSTQTLLTLAVSVLLLAGFIAIERRVAEPLMSFGLFRNRSLTVSNAAMLLFAAGAYSMMFFLSLYLQQVLGYSALNAGLAFLPMALGVVFGPMAGWVLTRIGARRALVSGLFLSALAIGWFGLISPDGTFLVNVVGPSVLISIGGQLCMVGLAVTAVSGVAESDYGIASGIFSTSRELGGAIGIGVLATVAATQTGSVAGTVSRAAALNHGFSAGFLGGASFVFIGFLLVVVLLPRIRSAPAAQDAPAEAAASPAGS